MNAGKDACGRVVVSILGPQVSQAVLLDNFVHATARMEAKKRATQLQRRQMTTRLQNPLDPLLERLARDYVDDADLSARIDEIFKARTACSSCKRMNHPNTLVENAF